MARWTRADVEAVLAGSSRSLTGMDLREADLSGLRFARVDLAYALLHGADLEGADLREAVLFATKASGVRLRGADLRGANLTAADLTGADLRGARLDGAALAGTDVSGAVVDPGLDLPARGAILRDPAAAPVRTASVHAGRAGAEVRRGRPGPRSSEDTGERSASESELLALAEGRAPTARCARRVPDDPGRLAGLLTGAGAGPDALDRCTEAAGGRQWDRPAGGRPSSVHLRDERPAPRFEEHR